ncbi:MAG: hypothetical protein V4547_20200 [Bacteroidota bacterium]
MRTLISALIMLMIISCGQENKEKNNAISADKDSIESHQVEPGDFKIGDIITTPCAIIVSPTESIIDSLIKDNEEDFYTTADDQQFYLSKVREYLDSTNTRTIDIVSKGNLRFKLADGKIINIALDEYYWNVLLFNGKTEPIKIDITGFIEEFDRYMK